jgi:hypothetical protein
MKSVPTFNATIYLGFKERDSGVLHSMSELRLLIQDYVDKIGLCVSLTATEFIYSNGLELGVIIGLINYPRFPSDADTIYKRALHLAEYLRVSFGQLRVSVVCGTETVMLGDGEGR